jgi:hypothetical protein
MRRLLPFLLLVICFMVCGAGCEVQTATTQTAAAPPGPPPAPPPVLPAEPQPPPQPETPAEPEPPAADSAAEPGDTKDDARPGDEATPPTAPESADIPRERPTPPRRSPIAANQDQGVETQVQGSAQQGNAQPEKARKGGRGKGAAGKTRPRRSPIAASNDQGAERTTPDSADGGAGAGDGNQAASLSAPEADGSTPNPPAATRTRSERGPLVKLSTGVALAQTLPDGTGMSFSVDYEVVEGRSISREARYVWIIEAVDQKTFEQQVTLADQGNLATLAPQLKPDDGPFHSYLAVVGRDGRRTPISDRIEMIETK